VSENEESAPPSPGAKPGSIAFYAEIYAANLRTVKRWKALGRTTEDATPLDNAEAMLAWWARNMQLRVPDGINAAVIRQRKEKKANPAPVERPVTMELPRQDLPIVEDLDKFAARKALMDIPVDEKDIGPEHTLRRLLELEPRLHRLADQPGQAKDYSAIVARIGPAAKALREENERMRKLIPKAEAETMIHEYHAPLEREIRQLARSMCEILGLPPTPHLMEAWHKQCDRLFARFQQEVFR
jgi:hypothetical protein